MVLSFEIDVLMIEVSDPPSPPVERGRFHMLSCGLEATVSLVSRYK